MSRARDLAALVTPNLFNQNSIRTQVGLGTTSIGAKIQVGGAVSAVTYFGDGSNLTGIALSAASSQVITNLQVTGITTLNVVNIGGTVFGGDFHNSRFTGVTTFAGQVSAGGSTGQSGQVLISTGSGVQWQDPVGIKSEIYVTAGAGVTQFTFTHDPNELNVFVNGIKLEPTEFSSDGGTIVSLATSTRAGDVVNLVGFAVSGYVGQVGSLTVRYAGTPVGNIGGIKIIDFEGGDISVVGTANSVNVNIPQRKGFVDSRDTRAYVSHEGPTGIVTQFSFLPIASSITYDNTDAYVAGFKQYKTYLNFPASEKYIGFNNPVGVGSDVILVGYRSNEVRTGIASTAVGGDLVFKFITGIGTPARIASGRPIDVYYRGVKLVENETYFPILGDAVILNQNVNVFTSDAIDIFSYTGNSKVGIATTTATEQSVFIELDSVVSSAAPIDVVVNGIKLAFGISAGVSSAIQLSPAPIAGSSVVVNSYRDEGKIGVATVTVGAGETIHLGTIDDEHFVNGLKISKDEINSVGVTSIASLNEVPEVGSIIENIRYSTARIGLTTITATSVGQTVFTDSSVTAFSKNNVDVFFNGVKLIDSDFSIVGTAKTVTVLGGLSAEIGDKLEVIQLGSGTRHGITTFSIPENFTLITAVSTGASVSVGSTQISIDSVTNVAVGDSVQITGAGTSFAVGVPIVSVGATAVFIGSGSTISNVINVGTAVTITRPIASVGQTNFTVGIPTGVPDTQVFLNGVKLDKGGASPEYVVLGAGNTVQLAVGVQAGDTVEIIGIVTDVAIYNREVATDKGSASFYNLNIDKHDSNQETFVNGVRVLGENRNTYAPNEYLYLTGGSPAGSIHETFRFASWARVGISTLVAPPARELITTVASTVGIGSTQIFLTSVANVAVGDTIQITGLGTDFSNGVSIVSVGATGVFIGAANTISSTIAAGVAATVRSGIGSTTVTISNAAFRVPNNDVYINGILSIPTVEYTVVGSGHTIQFANALAINDVVEVIGIATTARVATASTSKSEQELYEAGYHNATLTEVFVNGIRQQQSVVVDSVQGGKYVDLEGNGENFLTGDEIEVFQYGSGVRVGVTTFIATGAGQTNYTVGVGTGVPINDVYVNGVHLGKSDFTVIGSGVTIGLTTAPGEGSLIEIVGIATTARSGILTEYSAVVDGQTILPVYDASGTLEVYVNGVRYSKSQFSVDAGDEELRIDTAPSGLGTATAGDVLEIIEYNTNLTELGRTSANYRAFAGQREFQVAYTDKKLLDVYVNGLLISPDDYAADTGTNIVFNTALAANALVELTSYQGTVAAEWRKTSVGIFNTSPKVGVGTTATNYQLEVGYAGLAGTTLFVHGDARITGILSVGQGTVAIDGSTNEIRVGSGIIINGQSGIITATAISATSGFTGNATGLTSTASVNTSGIITATGGFVGNITGNLTGTATTATTALGFSTSVNINTVGILTATKMSAGIGSFTDTVVSGVITATTFVGNLTGNITGNVTGNATGLTATASVNTSGIITATGGFVGNLTGTATTATNALGLTTSVNINTTGIVTAGTFIGNLTGTATTATTALGINSTASLNTTGIITAATFSGSLIGNVQGTASIAQVALALTTNGSVNTSGIITATGGFVGNITGNLTGTASVASVGLALSTNSSVNTSGIITATGGFVGNITGNLTGTASVASVALALTTNGSVNTSGIITAAAFVSDGNVTLQGDNNILGIGTGYRVGVGTFTPATDAILELKSTTQVFLPPRMTTAQRNSIGSTSTGAIVFNSSTGKHQGYDGSSWNDFYI